MEEESPDPAERELSGSLVGPVDLLRDCDPHHSAESRNRVLVALK